MLWHVIPGAASACGKSCAAQAVLRCASFIGKTECEELCEQMAADDPDCGDLWNDLNACMANDDLICGVDSAPSTINLECRDLGDEWDECATGESPPERDPLEDACARSCLRQAQLDCRNDPSVVSCINGCIGIADMGCEQEWIDVNLCMADDPSMECNPSGNASTSAPDCLDAAEAYMNCGV